MAHEEGKLIVEVNIDEASPSVVQEKEKVSCPFSDEWDYFLPGSSNVQSTNSPILKDPYHFCRDVIVPETNGNELFYFFYNNILYKPPISNLWNKNLGKLILLEVFVNVDLIKALIKVYNIVGHAYHKKDRSILCTLDKETCIEFFDLGGPMTHIIKLEKLEETFKNQKSFLISKVTRRHIPRSMKEKGEILKKVGDFMPLEYFRRYFQYTIFDLDKVTGLDRTMNGLGSLYIMALDIYDFHINVGYDFFTHIINFIHNEIVVAQ